MKLSIMKKISGGQRTEHLLVAPYYIFFALFIAYPLIFSFVLIFHRWAIVGPLEWVGLSNILELGGDPLFWKSIGNTLIFLIIHVPLQVAFALVLAAILNSKIPAQGVFRAAFFLPVVVSGVAVTILWKQMFSTNLGILNQLLYELGINPVPWVTDPSWAMPSIAMMATWKNIGLYVVLFLAGLQGIPKHLYDAADIDGASTVQKFFHITVPAINPVFMVVLILSTLGGFSLFIEPYVITGGGPMNSTLSGVLYIYRQAFSFFRMGYAATIGFALAIIVMGVIIIQRHFME
ncbi:MAG: sugar ABC transporter permease, partial [Candidatus Neomarinimicrobiota bacterium]